MDDQDSFKALGSMKGEMVGFVGWTEYKGAL